MNDAIKDYALGVAIAVPLWGMIAIIFAINA